MGALRACDAVGRRVNGERDAGAAPDEVNARFEVLLRVRERADSGAGGRDVAGEVLATDLAGGVAVLGGGQAWPVEVEERGQGAVGEGRPRAVGVDVGGDALRDVVVAEPPAGVLVSTRALSLEVRARDLVNRPPRSFSSSGRPTGAALRGEAAEGGGAATHQGVRGPLLPGQERVRVPTVG